MPTTTTRHGKQVQNYITWKSHCAWKSNIGSQCNVFIWFKAYHSFCVHGHFFEDRRGGHSDGFLESPAFEADNGIVRQRPSEHNMINLLCFQTKRQQRNEKWHHILWHSHSNVNQDQGQWLFRGTMVERLPRDREVVRLNTAWFWELCPFLVLSLNLSSVSLNRSLKLWY